MRVDLSRETISDAVDAMERRRNALFGVEKCPAFQETRERVNAGIRELRAALAEDRPEKAPAEPASASGEDQCTNPACAYPACAYGQGDGI